MASNDPKYTDPKDRLPPGWSMKWGTPPPGPPAPVRSPISGRPMTGPAHGNARPRSRSDYDPRNPNHIILYTGGGKLEKGQAKMAFIRDGGRVEVTTVPRYVNTPVEIGEYVRRRRESLMKVFEVEVKKVEEEFDGQIQAELDRLKADQAWRKKRLEESMEDLRRVDYQFTHLFRIYRDARRNKKSDAEEAFRALEGVTRQRSQMRRQVRQLESDLGLATAMDASGMVKGDPRSRPGKRALGGLLDRSSAISLLRQRKRYRLRQLIRDAAKGLHSEIEKALPSYLALREAGQGMQVFAWAGPGSVPFYSEKATRELDGLRGFMVGLGVVREGRWGHTREGKEFLRAHGMTQYLEHEVYEGVPKGTSSGHYDVWYVREEERLRKDFLGTIDRYREFRAAAGAGASHDADVARDLERIHGVIRAYGRKVGDPQMARRDSISNRVLRAEIALLRAKYLRETGLPAELDDLLMREGIEARHELETARAEAATADARLKEAHAEARQARYAYTKAKKEWEAATLRAQKIAVEYAAIKPEYRAVMDAAYKQRRQLTPAEMQMIGPKALAFFARTYNETGAIENAMTRAQEAMRDAGEVLAAKQEVVARTEAVIKGESAPGAAKPKLQWQVKKDGGGDFVIKHGRYAGVRVADIPIAHLEYLARGAPFEKKWSWKGVTVEKGAARMLSPLEFERHKGSKLALPTTLKFTVHSDQERKDPGAGRRQIGEINFRHVREYLETAEGRMRRRTYRKHQADAEEGGFANPGNVVAFEELSRRRHAVTSRYSTGLAGKSRTISEGRMTPEGLKYSKRTMTDGEWAAYQRSSQSIRPVLKGAEDFGRFRRHMAPFVGAQADPKDMGEESRARYWFDKHMERLARSKMSDVEKTWIARRKTAESLQSEMRRDTVKLNVRRALRKERPVERTDLEYGFYTYYLNHYSPEEARRRTKDALEHVETARWQTPAAWADKGTQEVSDFRSGDGSRRALADIEANRAIEDRLRGKVYTQARGLGALVRYPNMTPGFRALMMARDRELARLERSGAKGLPPRTSNPDLISQFHENLLVTRALRGGITEQTGYMQLEGEEGEEAPVSVLPRGYKSPKIDALDLSKNFRNWVSTSQDWYLGQTSNFHVSLIGGLIAQTSTAGGLEALRDSVRRLWPLVEAARQGADVTKLRAAAMGAGYAMGGGTNLAVAPVVLQLMDDIDDREKSLRTAQDPTYLASLTRMRAVDGEDIVARGFEAEGGGVTRDILTSPGEYSETSGHAKMFLGNRGFDDPDAPGRGLGDDGGLASGAASYRDLMAEHEAGPDMEALVEESTGEIIGYSAVGPSPRHPGDIEQPDHVGFGRDAHDPLEAAGIVSVNAHKVQQWVAESEGHEAEAPSLYSAVLQGLDIARGGVPEGQMARWEETRALHIEAAGGSEFYSYGHEINFVERTGLYAGQGRRFGMGVDVPEKPVEGA